jgi:hypothetical protein
MSRRSGSTTVELLLVHFGWVSHSESESSGGHSVNVGQVAPAAACLFGPGRDGGHLSDRRLGHADSERAGPGPQSPTHTLALSATPEGWHRRFARAGRGFLAACVKNGRAGSGFSTQFQYD